MRSMSYHLTIFSPGSMDFLCPTAFLSFGSLMSSVIDDMDDSIERSWVAHHFRPFQTFGTRMVLESRKSLHAATIPSLR